MSLRAALIAKIMRIRTQRQLSSNGMIRLAAKKRKDYGLFA
jgi:hypothetical protein